MVLLTSWIQVAHVVCFLNIERANLLHAQMDKQTDGH